MLKQSLKTRLIEYIKSQRGLAISSFQIELLAKQWNYKISNAERRLREAKEIGKNYENGVLKSYYWKMESVADKLDVCCFSSVKFRDRKTGLPTHSRDCIYAT